MADAYQGRERREFLRYAYEKPIHYIVIDPSHEKDDRFKFFDVISKNLSAAGMLFRSKTMPKMSSIVILDLDFKTTRVCEEIEESILIINDKVLGKVVRVEATDDGMYDVGVAFIKKSEPLPSNIKDLLV